MDAPQILAALSGGGAGEATVTIPEGSNIYDIDRILSKALVIHPGALIDCHERRKIWKGIFSRIPISFIRTRMWRMW